MENAGKSKIWILLGGGLLMVSAIALGYQIFDMRSPPISVASDDKAFFTTDEGKTTFVDASSNIPPFMKDGKEAVRIYIYTCNGKQILGHLERYTPEGAAARRKIDDAARKGPPDANLVRIAMGSGHEIKRPGDKEWMKTTDFKATAALTAVKCPDGSEAQLVTPP